MTREEIAPRAGVSAGARDSIVDRRVTITALALAVVVAAYTGFRLPSSWTATINAASIFDGCHRRFVIGTLLRPFALATDFNYALFATFSYLVLAALIGTLLVLAVSTEILTRRLLVLAWLVLPTGGFMFHEVGYGEQLLYLLMFGATFLVCRKRLVAATALMSIGPFVHEIAIVTVVPIFGLVLLHEVPCRRAVMLTAIPAALALIVLYVSPAAPGTVDHLAATLDKGNFQYRVDALTVFAPNRDAIWAYRVRTVAMLVRPIALFLVGSFAVVWAVDRRAFWSNKASIPGLLTLVASCLAIGAPAFLIYAGMDGNRWAFLVIANFFVVVWLGLRGGTGRELRVGAIAVLVVATLVVERMPIYYFKPDSPRELSSGGLGKFIKQIRDGTLFELPTM